MTRIDGTAGGAGAGADTWKGLVAGLVGGVAGSLAMAAAQGMLGWARGGGPGAALDPTAGDIAANDRRSTGRDRPSTDHRPSTVRAVGLLRRAATGHDLPRRHEAMAGRAFHFAFGTALGGAYGLLVEHVRWTSIGAGLPFGAAQVVFADELSVPALELSEPAWRATASARASSLLAHSCYGLATELVRRRVRAWL